METHSSIGRQQWPSEGVLKLRTGQAAIFGYGSLLSTHSMERTLGRRYVGPRVICGLAGRRRSWNVIMPNHGFYAVEEGVEFAPEHIIYLNVRPSSFDVVNGVLYVIEPHELAMFDEREWIYDRLAVTAELRGVTVAGGEAYAYVAKAEWRLEHGRPRAWAAVRHSYVNIVESGVAELEEEVGAGFRIQYDQSTDPVPAPLVFVDLKRDDSLALLAHRKPA